MENPFYTVKEVRKILGVGENKIYQLLVSGTIPRKKIGSTYRIPKDYFDKWINEPDQKGLENE